MKLMYSIIIVLAAAALVFLAIKKADKPVAQEDISTTTMDQNTQPSQPQVQPQPQPVASSELMMTTTRQGTGPEAKEGDTVSVHYTGYLADGSKFDSSVDRGQPFEFTLGEGKVIKGWEIGVKGMKKGEVRKLIIPPQYAYGEAGFPGVIPGNATLAFEVELLEIK